MRGLKKLPVMSKQFGELVSVVSKSALIDALWCACQLGTDESSEQITSQAARNIVIALRERGDKVPEQILAAAAIGIDSD